MATTESSSRRYFTRKRILLTIILLFIVLVTIAIFLILSGIRNAPIPVSNPPSELSFLTIRDGIWDVYLLKPDGTEANLTLQDDGASAHDYFGSWAMDGSRLNALSNRTGEIGPTQVEPDGSNPRNLDILSGIVILFGEGRLDWDPSWSPDGTQVLWSSLRDLNLELYTIPTDSDFIVDSATRLTDHAGRDWFGKWSPDGTHVVFSSDRDGNENIYVVDLASGQMMQLTNQPEDELHPVWSLDGTQILYVFDENDGLLDGILTLYIMNADGSNQRPFMSEMIFEGDPTWFADGSQLLYMSNVEGDWNIYLRDVDGSNVQRLTESSSDELYPVWRP